MGSGTKEVQKHTVVPNWNERDRVDLQLEFQKWLVAPTVLLPELTVDLSSKLTIPSLAYFATFANAKILLAHYYSFSWSTLEGHFSDHPSKYSDLQ